MPYGHEEESNESRAHYDEPQPQAAPLKVLPRIRRVVGTEFPVVVDCAINRGLDAFKAIALGADAVCVGRKVIGGLKTNGSDGVKDVLDEITEELRWAMNVTGTSDIRLVDPGVIVY